MTHPEPPRWLEWAREIQALSQTGSHYAVDDYQRERYSRLSQIAAEIIGEYSDLDCSKLVYQFNQQMGYATPKVDVRGAVFHDDRILLVRERADGRWTLPGGWADVGDIPSQSAEREVWEEAGFQVKASKLVGVYDANRHGPLEIFHAYKLVFLCSLVSGSARPSLETSEVAFFTMDQIPAHLSEERTQPRHIQDAWAAYQNRQLPAVFD